MSGKKELFGLNSSMLLQCAMIYICICAGLWIHSYFLIVVAGITVLTAAFGKIESVYYQLFFSIPFTVIYKLSPTSTSLFAYLMLGVGFLLILRLNSINRKFFAIFMVYAVYIFIGMGGDYTTVIKMLMGLVLLFIFVTKIEACDFKNQIIAFTLGMLGSSFIGLLKTSWLYLNMFFSDIDTILVGGKLSFRFSGLYYDPNYYSISVICAVFLCLLLIINKNANRVFLCIITAMLVLFGFISYSKLYLLSILILALSFTLSQMKSPKKVLSSIFVVLALCSLFYLWAQNTNYISIMMSRLVNSDISTGRFNIWRNYIQHILNSPKALFFGEGIGAPYIQGRSQHNSYIELIYFLGIFGSILFLLAIVNIFRIKRYIAKRTIINYTLLGIFCMMIGTLGVFKMNDFMFYLM